MQKHLAILGATAALLASSLAGAAFAQNYPTKPVNIIVGFGAGGGTDAVVRAVAEPMSKSLGQPVLVQNKPGAGGGVAAMTIKAAEPDGYTLIATGSLTFTFEPQVLQTQYKYDDFEHVAVISLFQDGLFTNPKRPYKTMKDVIATAKAEKRSIKYASQFQLDRMIFQYVAKKEGVEIIPVPTQGGNGTVQAVLADQVDFGFSGGTYGPHVESGALRLIGAMSAKRMERFPEIAGMNDNGWDIGSENYLIVSTTKGTPKPVVEKLAKALSEGMKTEAVQNVVKSRYMKDLFVGPNGVMGAVENHVKM
ncbi:MAG TPA: tripartite tricarboxylate transporter substrate binding protein, partial [Hyphomicrobiaceae bacterium]|nr:tripartite tricarboxylate transporter substrate binding protein [Hyphomicrobiaceae bacterium]